MYRTHGARMMTSAGTQLWLPRESGVPEASGERRRSLLGALQLARQLHVVTRPQLMSPASDEDAECGDWGPRLRVAGVPRVPRGSSFFLWAPSREERLLRDAEVLAFFLSYLRRLLAESARRPEGLGCPLGSLRGVASALAALCHRLGSALRPPGQPPANTRLRLLHSHPPQQRRRQGGDAAADDDDVDVEEEDEEDEEKDRQMEGALQIPAVVMMRELQAWLERTVRDLDAACNLRHEMS